MSVEGINQHLNVISTKLSDMGEGQQSDPTVDQMSQKRAQAADLSDQLLTTLKELEAMSNDNFQKPLGVRKAWEEAADSLSFLDESNNDNVRGIVDGMDQIHNANAHWYQEAQDQVAAIGGAILGVVKTQEDLKDIGETLRIQKDYDERSLRTAIDATATHVDNYRTAINLPPG